MSAVKGGEVTGDLLRALREDVTHLNHNLGSMGHVVTSYF